MALLLAMLVAEDDDDNDGDGVSLTAFRNSDKCGDINVYISVFRHFIV